MFRLAVGLSLATCVFTSRTTFAQAVTYVSQDRRIEALIHEQFRIDDKITEVEDQELIAAPDFAPFDETARAQAEPTGFSRISQRSTLAGDGIVVSGNWAGEVATINGYYRFDTLVATTFDVTGGAVRYDLSYRIGRPDVLPGRQDVDLVLAPAGGAAVFDVEPVYEEQPDSRYSAVGTASGELAPGRYDFRFFQRTINDPGLNGSYAVDLRLSPVPEPSAGAPAPACAALLLLRRNKLPRAR